MLECLLLKDLTQVTDEQDDVLQKRDCAKIAHDLGDFKHASCIHGGD